MLQAARTAGFEVLHGLLNRVMDVLGVAVDQSLGGPADSGKLPRYAKTPGRVATRCGMRLTAQQHAAWCELMAERSAHSAEVLCAATAGGPQRSQSSSRGGKRKCCSAASPSER